jgi:hypothetical protein
MSERILEAVPTMVKGESKTFESPLKVKLTKNVNYTAFDHIGGTWFLDVKEIKDTEESYRGALLVEKPDWDSDEEYNFDLETDRWEENWQIPQEVSIQIKLSLEAADRKLENFAEGMYKALVLDFQFDQLFDDYLYIAKLQGRQKTCREIINISTVYTS